MSYPMIEIGDLMLKRNGSVDPSKFPDETFELHSIPAFDKGTPDIVKGSEIGSSKQLVQENDVMISKIVPHIRRASVVCPKGDYRQIASGEWIVFRSDKIYPDYLKHVLISDTFNKQFMATVSGVGGSLLRARPAFVAKIKIALPPLSEQRRIASILDQADELRQKRQQAIEKLDQLLQATFIDMFGDPVSNPKGWEVKKLSELSTKIHSGNTPKGGSENYVDQGIIFLRSQNVWKNKVILDDVAYIDAETHSKMMKSSVKHEDLLMTKTGRINTENSSLGRAAIYLGEDDSANINGHVYLIRIKDGFNKYFILRILTLPDYYEYIRSVCVGGIDKRQLNKEHIENFPIIQPPMELQNKFSNIVQVIESQKPKLLEQLDLAENLFKTLQQKAFNGTL
ncbi:MULTISPECIES: restriction endonuclease subunit S [Acinetobacter]|uniref:restriction endonuclease subunit S n=1 Tax=Acinetobacter TaxID=469 RepID=UPI00029E9E8C|nr:MULTISPECIES: restriction endonuclease subunit S [Acinetobacter]EKU60973.1 type I restriction modification DNA specificity domain protein [Acinetobacter nosocomialis]EXI11125.1 type I restriction modification DNA specificity domain protein [Acinetobacter sp. 694762]